MGTGLMMYLTNEMDENGAHLSVCVTLDIHLLCSWVISVVPIPSVLPMFILDRYDTCICMQYCTNIFRVQVRHILLIKAIVLHNSFNFITFQSKKC